MRESGFFHIPPFFRYPCFFLLEILNGVARTGCNEIKPDSSEFGVNPRCNPNSDDFRYPKKCLSLTREKDKISKVQSVISSSASHTLRSIDKLVLCQGSIFGYDGLPVRRQRLPPTDWKSVVQIQFNPNFKG